VLINCGACDFIQDLAPESAANVRFIIVDSHRPVHPKYNNDDDSDHFLLLADDDPLQLQSIPVCSELDDLAIEGKKLLLPIMPHQQYLQQLCQGEQLL
jgi:hypothetical protein